jgi:hypothetical protein
MSISTSITCLALMDITALAAFCAVGICLSASIPRCADSATACSYYAINRILRPRLPSQIIENFWRWRAQSGVWAVHLRGSALRAADSSSMNAVSFPSARTTKRFPSTRCASATKIVLLLDSSAERQTDEAITIFETFQMIGFGHTVVTKDFR